MRIPKPLVAPLRLARSTGQRMQRGSNVRIVESFPMFAPMSAGSMRIRATLAIQAARQTFPFMLELLSSTGTKIQDPTPIAMFADTEEKQAAALRLKELLDQYDSDKGAPGHSYHLLYGPILAAQDATAVLEIGLGTNNVRIVSHMGRNGRPGASHRAFRDFLPDAQIYGADIDRGVLFNEDRIATFFVDQTDISSFSALGASVPGDFDLIIDDGLHSPNANLASLMFGLGRLKLGGCFVVEDISPHALAIWQVIGATLLPPDRYTCQVVAAEETFLFLVRRLA